jgi:ATP-dependent Clp protease ATP-binding subunit ClpA
MSQQYERFTQRARRVLAFAQEETKAINQQYIGTDHVLIALMREEGGVAFHALKACGVEDIARMRTFCNTFPPTQPLPTIEDVDLEPETKDLLYAAVDTARQMGNHFIGTEHLLLGIINQQKCRAYQALWELGVTPDQIRQQVYEIVITAPEASRLYASLLTDPHMETFYPVDVRAIFEAARQRAAQMRHRELEPEHLLLGLLDKDSSDTLALFRELGMNKDQAVDMVLSAANGALKHKDAAHASPLGYSNLTQTGILAIGKILPHPISQLNPRDLLLALMVNDWILVRLWSLLNVDNYGLRSALARAGLADMPPARYSIQNLREHFFIEQIEKLMKRIFRLK